MCDISFDPWSYGDEHDTAGTYDEKSGETGDISFAFNVKGLEGLDVNQQTSTSSKIKSEN
jgi:hypothetical protein